MSFHRRFLLYDQNYDTRMKRMCPQIKVFVKEIYATKLWEIATLHTPEKTGKRWKECRYMFTLIIRRENVCLNQTDVDLQAKQHIHKIISAQDWAEKPLARRSMEGTNKRNTHIECR